MSETPKSKFSLTDSRQVAIREGLKGIRYPQTFRDFPFSEMVLAASLPEQREWLLAMLPGIEILTNQEVPKVGDIWYMVWEMRELCFALLKRKLSFTAADMVLLTDWILSIHSGRGSGAIAKAYETYFKTSISPHDSAVLAALQKVSEHFSKAKDGDIQRNGHKLEVLLNEVNPPANPRPIPSPLSRSDAWADAAQAEIDALNIDAANAWNTLLTTCSQAKAGSPSAVWLKQAYKERDRVGLPAVRAALLRWFPLVDTPHIVSEEDVAKVREHYRNQYREVTRWTMISINGDILKGLVWLLADQGDAEMARAIRSLIKDSFRKIPGVGARLARVGNAGLWTLGQMPGMEGVAQLAILKTRLKLPIIQKQISAAFDETAKRLNLNQTEIEELVVPTYGLGENGQPIGVRVDEFDEYRAEIRLVDNEPTLHWYKADGEKALSAVPQAVKAAYPDEVKDLTQTVKDLRSMLTAQKERLDSLFLAQKSWPYAVWRERYLDHALMGLIARRIIWKFRRGGQDAVAIWHDGQLVDSNDQPVTWPDDETLVELWHPLNAYIDVVQSWRRWLDVHQVQQPFKQAHREVYLLTDAERNTVTYSNRFAAHIIKQHQFSALCAARGWKHQLRIMADATYPAPHRLLENWGLRVEYWVESVGMNYGTDTTDSGTYLYLSTDQVRFYPIGSMQSLASAFGGGYDYGRNTVGQPLSLESIPPLVFSEMMRDVDLFVGVASVGNDSDWVDGGPGGRHIDYWYNYALGDVPLSESAKTRRQVLELLLPRLKIASRCRLDDRFLIVRGDIHTYKIHLGSGNILTEDGHYLCIVPDNLASRRTGERIFLPFEGDHTFALILSKAFLLANDEAIKDKTITRQLLRR